MRVGINVLFARAMHCMLCLWLLFPLGCASQEVANQQNPSTRPARIEIVDAYLRADVPFPEFAGLWSERFNTGDADGSTALPPLGATVKIFVRNAGAEPITLTNVSLESVDLSEAVAFSETKAARLFPANIRFSNLPEQLIERLKAAGEPVWWKVDPQVIGTGEFAEVTIRLRRGPSTGSLHASVEGADVELRTGDAGSAPGMGRGVRSISFSPSLDKIYAYLCGPVGMDRPSKVFMDSTELSAQCVAGVDSNLDTVPIILTPSQPLKRGSFHCLRAEWPDGARATVGIRAFQDDLVYGMWGYANKGDTEEQRTMAFLQDLKTHNINAVMYSYGKGVGQFLAGEQGLENSKRMGIRAMRTGPGGDLNPLCYFLKDEPDAHDYAVAQLEARVRLGSLGQPVVRLSEQFRKEDPLTPQLLNVDNTFKPENWYMYGQLPDIMCADPYFQEQQRIVWTKRPGWAARFLKPTYVLGVSTICRWACEPRPLHIILNSVRHMEPGDQFRYATPEEKTMELFYALGAGATGFSYWWYTPYGNFRGCGADEPAAVALWTQIGLLGAQVRTAGPLLVRGCPVNLPLTTTAGIWSRTLAAGLDSLVLVLVNDKVASDRLGTVVSPIEKAMVQCHCPSWIEPKDAFEILPDQVRSVPWKSTGNNISLDLGTFGLARLVIVTSDPALRDRLSQLHKASFSDAVSALHQE